MTEKRSLNHFLQDELARLKSSGLLRDASDPIALAGCSELDLLVLCSNDYLGYASEPLPREGFVDSAPSGSGASRLVSGSHPAHVAAERELASWVGAESALLFSSGFAANVGAISALASRGDRIISDALNHASIIDGCRLSGATIVVVPHNDAGAVEIALREANQARRTWVVTESYFSMDGDIPDLVRLRALCDEHGASLVVDEAHALGVFGPRGAGLCAEVGVRPDVFIGTLGKAVGLQGAFVAGPNELRTYLWNKARSFVFSTGVSPALAGAAVARVQRVINDDAGRQRLATVAARLRDDIARVCPSVRQDLRGPIIPWVIGDVDRAVRASKAARDRGVLVQAIRPPTVPTNTARLRITATARLTEADLERASRVFAEVAV